MADARLRDRHGALTHLCTQAGAGWLGVFAILMMFIGPVLSQSMPMGPASHHGAQAGMDMPMPAGMVMETSHAGHDHSLHPLWEKCGYCSLFLHTPALPSSPPFLAAGSPRQDAQGLYLPRLGHAGQAVFPGARTRAPPASSQA